MPKPITNPDTADAELPLPSRPVAPWLRLALNSTTPPAAAVDYARLRWIRDYEIIVQLDGVTWQWCGHYPHGGSIEIRPGDVLFIPPGYVHGWAYHRGTHAAVHFDLHANPALAAYRNLRPMDVRVPSPRALARSPQITLRTSVGPAFSIPMLTRVNDFSLWKKRVTDLIRLHERDDRSIAGRLRAAETLTWMLTTLAGESGGDGTSPSAPAPGDPLVTAALAAADRSPLHRPPAIGDLVESSGAGRTAFGARFRAATGQTPRAFFERRRIERAARELIATDRPIAVIAAAHGFDDPYHFSRVFKRVTGSSPRAHRRLMRRD